MGSQSLFSVLTIKLLQVVKCFCPDSLQTWNQLAQIQSRCQLQIQRVRPLPRLWCSHHNAHRYSCPRSKRRNKPESRWKKTMLKKIWEKYQKEEGRKHSCCSHLRGLGLSCSSSLMGWMQCCLFPWQQILTLSIVSDISSDTRETEQQPYLLTSQDGFR